MTEAQIVFKLALKGKHIKTIRFLINNDSANMLLNSEDVKLLSEWDVGLCALAVEKRIQIKRNKASIIKIIDDFLQIHNEKVFLWFSKIFLILAWLSFKDL